MNIIKILRKFPLSYFLFAFFLFAATTYGATTIGTNILTGGTLSVSGDTSLATASTTGLVKVHQLKVASGGSTVSSILFGSCTVTTPAIPGLDNSFVDCPAAGVTSDYKVFITDAAEDVTLASLITVGAVASTTNNYIYIEVFATGGDIDPTSKTWSWMAIK